MASAFFISETYLKDNSPISGNVDMNELYPFAKTAEEIYIQEAIGSPLFERLIAGVQADDLTANEIILTKKIRSALVFYTCYDALPFISIKLRNVGLVKQSGADLESATREDTTYLRNECKNKADFYINRVKTYLCKNSSLFQEYCCAEWDCSKIMPDSRVHNSSDLAIDRNDRNDSIDTEFFKKWLNGQ